MLAHAGKTDRGLGAAFARCDSSAVATPRPGQQLRPARNSQRSDDWWGARFSLPASGRVPARHRPRDALQKIAALSIISSHFVRSFVARKISRLEFWTLIRTVAIRFEFQSVANPTTTRGAVGETLCARGDFGNVRDGLALMPKAGPNRHRMHRITVRRCSLVAVGQFAIQRAGSKTADWKRSLPDAIYGLLRRSVPRLRRLPVIFLCFLCHLNQR